MDPLAFLLSSSGRFSPRQFALGVLLVYAAALLSQALLAPEVLARLGLASFAVVQAAVLWMWFVVHAKRLRDAGRSVGPAAGVAVLCLLAVLLLILLLVLFQQVAASDPDELSRFIGMVAILYLLEVISGHADFGAISAMLALLVGLAFMPFLIAVAFSLWAGTRPPIATPPEQAPAGA